MKFCPFLVAGQSMAAPQQRTASASSAFATPDVDAILHDSPDTKDLFANVDEEHAKRAAARPDSADHADAPAAGTESRSIAGSSTDDELGIVRFHTPSFSTSLPVAGTAAGGAPIVGIECLGSVCRFFNNGGCRFDALFESQAKLVSGPPLVHGTIVDGPETSLVATRRIGDAKAAGDDVAGASPSVLDEVWSLQRESLREVMSGFQRVESGQAGLQSGVASQIESSVGRVESTVGKVATQVGGVNEQVNTVASQVGTVASQVGKMHSQVSDAMTHLVRVAASVGQVGASVGKVETRVGEIGASVGQVESRVGEVGVSVGKVEARVGEVGSTVGQVGQQIGQVGSSMSRVESQVTKVESQVTSVAAAVTTVESQVKRVESHLSNVQASVAVVASEIHDLRAQLATVETQVKSTGDPKSGVGPEFIDLVGRHFEALERDVRQLEGILRGTIGETLRTAIKESLSHATSTTDAGLRTVLQNLQSGMRSVVQESQEMLRSAVAESSNQMGSLVARSTNETRAQLERGLGKVLEEFGAVRDTRTQLQTALDGLVRETREVGALARRVESSQVLTHELLDEQRNVTAKLDERERRERARQLNNAGVLSYHQGAYDSSVGHFKQATDLDPSLAEAFNNLGLSYTEMGRDEEATIAFQRALELDPQAAHVYNNLGYLYYRKGDLNHAVDMYQRAIQRGADSSAAYSNLANAYYRLKRVEQAVASWRRALEIDPSNTKAATALERLGLDARPS